MILILSKETAEISTEKVIDWLLYWKADFYRLNGEDFFNGRIVLSFFLEKESKAWKFTIFDKILNKEIKSDDITAVWFRRSFNISFIKDEIQNINDLKIKNEIESYLISELSQIYLTLENCLENRFWLNKFKYKKLIKLEVLNKASLRGFKVPYSIITNSVKVLESNLNKNFLITKPMDRIFSFITKNKRMCPPTTRINIKDYTRYHGDEKLFFPSFFQEEVKKKFEIRVFFILCEIYAIAIYSQSNEKTSVDFRNFDNENYSRNEPITLPKDVQKKICLLMSDLKLNCGSLDLIKSTDDDYVFLEVNPVGQFGFVSYAGNYNLEKKVAEVLIKKANER